MVWDLLAFSSCGSVAQIFIFSCLEEYGGFVTTTICTSRKVLQVVLSVLLFPPATPIALTQWVGFFNVFCGLSLQSICSGGWDIVFAPSPAKKHK